MESYVVRVFWQEKNNPRKMVGVVEEAGVAGRRTFSNIEDLWKILSAANRGSRAKKKSEIQEDAVA